MKRNVVKGMGAVLAIAMVAMSLPQTEVKAAEVLCTIEQEEVALESGVYAGLDEILKQAYAYYSAGDYRSLYTLDVSEATKNYVELIQMNGADRYICKLNENMDAMLYILNDGYSWYFGTTENGLRAGNGTTVAVSKNGYDQYEGGYSNDLPFGNGKCTQYYYDDSEFVISGNYTGPLLDGVYEVQVTDIGKGQVCKMYHPYVNNHLMSDFEQKFYVTGMDEEMYLGYYDGGEYIEFGFLPWNIGSYDILSTLEEGSEPFVIGVFWENISGGEWVGEYNTSMRWVSEYANSLENGLFVLRGNPNGIVSADATVTPVQSTAEEADAEQEELNVSAELTVEPEATEETKVEEQPIVVTPQPVEGDIVYIVKAGDTLGSISANYYGNNSKGAAIREQNKEAFAANKGRLAEGMQLVLPERLGGKTRIAEPTVNASEALYTVMHGDTLCGIAKKIYGTEAKSADIFARNSDRLSDAGKLFPGQVIVLPVE